MIEVVSEDSLLIRFGSRIDPALVPRIADFTDILRRNLAEYVIDLVPSYTTLLVIYDPALADAQAFRQRIARLLREQDRALHQPGTGSNGDIVRLPVWYDPESGPDLEFVASRSGLSPGEVIDRHTAGLYLVFALGFNPGFAFMGEVDPAIACPRRKSPRASVPPGSVAIVDRQTAVYPVASPGGWQLIGRCPALLFDEKHLSRLKVGDRVRFEAISRERFRSLGGKL